MTTMETPKAGRREWIGLTVLALATASGEEAVADVRTAAKPSEAARHDLLSAGRTVSL